MAVIYGHRGARGLYPENTIPGFLYAAGSGIRGIEMDVVISGDKKVVVSHEPWFNPKITTTPKGVKVSLIKRRNLYKMSYAQIRQYDCGLRGNPNFPAQKKMPSYKPLLSEVIEAVENHIRSNHLRHVNYLIEIKSRRMNVNKYYPPIDEFVELVVNVIKDFKIDDRIIIQSFDACILNELMSQKYNYKTGLLVITPHSLGRKLKGLPATPILCGINYRWAKKKWIEVIHRLGMEAFVWGVSDKESVNKVLAAKVDGIITDYPERVLSLLP